MKAFLKTLLAVVCALIIVGVLKFIGFFMLLGVLVGASDTSSSTPLQAHSAYRLRMDGILLERTEEDPYAEAVAEVLNQPYKAEYGLDDILRNIRIAKENKKIDGILIEGGSMQMGYASAKAIRDALIDFHESGKWIVAYADNYTQANYYVASVADRICVNPSGSIDWKGMSATIEFYTRLLEKLGVEMQVVKVGTYKSAVEPYILTSMSEANRQQYDALLHSIWSHVCESVSQSRHISVEELNQYADLRLEFQPEETMLEWNFADTLCYTQDLDGIMAEMNDGIACETISHNKLTSLQTGTVTNSPKIAVLYAEGDITDDYGTGIVGTDMIKLIDELADDDAVRSVVLRVSSPGGSAYASEQIHHALELLKAKKPLVVSMGDYAASGGYYISCGANYIFAEPTTITGSIGIFGLIPNIGGLASKVGIDFDGVKTNLLSDMDENAVYHGMNSQERELMQSSINRGYDLFTRRCAEGRGVSQESIKAIAEGRVWSGTQAIEIGLVDELGNLSNAIACAALLANLDDYQVVDYPEKEDALTRLMNLMNAEARADRFVEARIGKENLRTLHYLEQICQKPQMQARMEYMLKLD